MDRETILPISEARKKIFEIAEEVQKPGKYYTITEKGRPKMVIMSYEAFDNLMDDLEIMSDPDLLKRIEEAEAEIERGNYVTWDELKKELGYVSDDALVAADKGKKKYSAKKKNK